MPDKTMLYFKRGTNPDALTNFTAIKVEITEDTNASVLRKALGGDMLKSDRFLDVHGFPLSNSTDAEASTRFEDLVVVSSSKDSSGKSPAQSDELDESSDAQIPVIRILAKEEKKREAIKLGDWPKDPGFWASDIMNDTVLPPKNAPGIAAPEGTADLSAFLDVNSFGIVQWAELIKSNNLLKGVRMGNSGPRPSAFAIVEGPPDLKHFYTFRQPNSYIDVQTVTSEHTSKFITQGWLSGSLSIGTPFVSVAVEATTRQMDGTNTVHKTIFTTASYKYAFVTIVFDPTTLTPTAEFNSAVQNALQKESEDAKRAALRDLFNRYGHSFQTEVMLGAMLTTTDSIKTDAATTQSKFENSIKAKLSAAIPSFGIEFGASLGAGEGSERKEQVVDQEERKIVTAKGGNPLLSTALTKWIPSVADYRTWRVIEVGSAVPITEFIRDPATKQQVAKLSNADPDAHTKPLRGRWVEAREDNTNAQGDGKSWFRTYRPVLDDGWYWLGQSLDDRWALQVRENGSYGEALGPVRDTTLIHKNAGSEAKDYESFWTVHAVDTDDYVFLGDHFQSGKTDGEDKPDLRRGQLPSLRAVRKDLCVKATISEKPYWSNETTKDKRWVTVYEPAKQGPERIFNHYVFKAFEKSLSDRSMIVSESQVYMLKESSIFVENRM